MIFIWFLKENLSEKIFPLRSHKFLPPKISMLHYELKQTAFNWCHFSFEENKRFEKDLIKLCLETKSQFAEDESDYVLSPAPGVVFTVFNTTRTGPKRPAASNKQSLVLERSEHNLRPVKQIDENSVTRSSIDEILNNSNKSVKAPVKLKPIPPISPSTFVN